jgi:hypothetical protein
MIKRLLTLLALCVVSLQAVAQTNWQDLERYLQRLYQDPAFVERTLDRYSLTGHPREVLRWHFNEVYKNTEITKTIIAELKEMRFDRNSSSEKLLSI